MESIVQWSLTVLIALIAIVNTVPAAMLPVTTLATKLPVAETTAAAVAASAVTNKIYIPLRDKDTLLEKVIENLREDEELLKKKRENLQTQLRDVKSDQKAISKELNDVTNLIKSVKEQRELSQKALKLAKRSAGVA